MIHNIGSRSSERRLELYHPLHGRGRLAGAAVIAQASGDPASLIPLIKGQVWVSDRNLPIRRANTLERMLAESV